jgi:hypothetical protein
MEKNGWIKCVRNKHGKTYGANQHRQEIMNDAAASATAVRLSRF